MWNSPHSKIKGGKRYQLRDIAVLTCALDQMLDFLESSSVADVVHEKILRRMDKEELIYAIYQVLEALLEDVPVPKGGHPGYHEAIVAELLYQTRILIGCELDDSEYGDSARKDAWTSLSAFCLVDDPKKGKHLWQLEDLKLNFKSSRIHCSEKITSDHWDDMLLGEGGLWDEFLWDDDWRMDNLMDLPTPTAKKVTDLAGIDLEIVHALPHTPTQAELNMAEHYIRYVIWKDEATRPSEGE